MIDKEMYRLVCLGILKKDMPLYSSPIMLIARKNFSVKRIITDFRFLISRLQRVNLDFPLIRDVFAILGSSKCDCISVLDLKDVCYTIKLSENSKPYCSTVPYFDSASYVYQRMPMGLSASPAIWQSYINAILSSIPDTSKC